MLILYSPVWVFQDKRVFWETCLQQRLSLLHLVISPISRFLESLPCNCGWRERDHCGRDYGADLEMHLCCPHSSGVPVTWPITCPYLTAREAGKCSQTLCLECKVKKRIWWTTCSSLTKNLNLRCMKPCSEPWTFLQFQSYTQSILCESIVWSKTINHLDIFSTYFQLRILKRCGVGIIQVSKHLANRINTLFSTFTSPFFSTNTK